MPAGTGSVRQIADHYWDLLLEIEPFVGTEVGDERFDDLLPDPSEAGRERAAAIHAEAAQAAAGFDRGSLDSVERTTLEVMEAIATRGLAEIEARLDRLTCVSHMGGPGELLALMGGLQPADTPARVDRFVGRLQATPNFLDSLVDVMRDGVQAGQTAPGVVVDRTIGQIERLLAIPAAESPALSAFPAPGAPGRERAVEAIRDRVMPAYERYLAGLREYRPHATETIGLCDLPGGDGVYAAQILSWVTLGMPAREIHEIGVRELALIQEERRRIAWDLGYPDAAAAIGAHTASGRNSAASREDLVRIATEQVARGWEAAPAFFGRLPSENCLVRPVEEYREEDEAGAFYFGPTADGRRKGTYYINTANATEWPLHQLATTTYHEANPGHHFQVTLEQEFGDRPRLRRFGGILAGSAFIEGWGLYSERLADEMGLYENDYERLGMLDMQAHRACRLIVDTGIHALGWGRDRAVAKMAESGLPAPETEVEVDRYIAIPGQALSYMIGMLEIRGARQAAERRDGAAFDLRDFHDRLLSLGSVPLPVLRKELG